MIATARQVLAELIDRDDLRIIAQGVVLFLLAALVVIATAATAGVAWRVLEFAAGY